MLLPTGIETRVNDALSQSYLKPSFRPKRFLTSIRLVRYFYTPPL